MQVLWREASAVKRALLVGGPIAVIALVIAGAAFAMSGGGGEAADKQEAVAATATDTAATATATIPPVPTETPASAGLQATDAPPPSSGGGAPVRRADPPAPNLSGPGAPTGTGMSMQIPAIGVNAGIYGRSVGENGQMGNPSGAWDVIWYDFSQNWAGLGGFPGEPGANAVFAGHVDYIRVGPAVFWSIRDLAPGDQVTVNTESGPITYVIDWSQWAEPDQDFTGYVERTGQDVITLVTCIGGFSGGHYSNRLIVRGHRI
ncbi:MAG: class F sortase [Chloroflexi bacterium]|nr:class F sortase [Chloroflexota bacterium]